MSDNDDLIDELLAKGVFDYGATIKVDALMAMFGAQVSEDDDLEGFSVSDIRAQIKADSVVELSVSGRVRERLLDEGRYLGKVGDYYRVYLPSENANKAAGYLASSAKKAARASRLLASTPVEFSVKTTHTSRAAIAKIVADRKKNKKR